jgi:Polymer-forming cytoskeletal
MRLRNDERGAAIVAVVSLTAVLAGLGLVATDLAVHTGDASARRRDRVAAAHAAETGINEALKQMSGAAGALWCGAPASPATKLPGGGDAPGGQQYAVTVSDSDPADGPCTATDPLRLVVATGYSPSATVPQPATRTMEAQVHLLPQTAAPTGYGFDKAIHSTGSLSMANSTQVLGDGTGNNADVYAGTTATIPNSAELHGDIFSQGNVSLQNSVKVWGDVVATGNVSLTNSATVYGNVISATGSVSLTNSATVTGFVRAATTVSLTNSWSVGGHTSGACAPNWCYANSPSTPPPVESLPNFTWNSVDPWPQPVTSWSSCADFTTWLGNNKTNFKGTHRISPSCGVTLSNSWEVTLTGDAAIVTDGWIKFRNSTKFKKGNGNYKLYLVSLHAPGGADPEAGIEMVNSTEIQPPTLFFARNKITKANSTQLYGQIYADRVSIANSFVLNFRKVAAPGFTAASGESTTVTGYHTQVVYLRETS